MGFSNAFFLIVGLFAIAVSVWSRMGRTKQSRWWVDMGSSESVALMIAPSIATFATFAGVGPLIGDIESLNLPLGLLLFAAVVFTIWGGIVLHIPRWFYPRWYRLNKGWIKPSDRQARSKVRSSNTKRWHHSSGFSMPLPQAWTHEAPEDPLVALIAIEQPAHGVLEQWVAMVGEIGYTASFSAGTMSYEGLADQFASLASHIEFSNDPACS